MKKKVKMIFSGASTIVEVPRVIGGLDWGVSADYLADLFPSSMGT